jgi:hypothetical protein
MMWKQLNFNALLGQMNQLTTAIQALNGQLFHANIPPVQGSSLVGRLYEVRLGNVLEFVGQMEDHSVSYAVLTVTEAHGAFLAAGETFIVPLGQYSLLDVTDREQA